MMIRFTESEMEFELQEDRSCNLERSLLYQSLNRHAVSAVECVGVYELRGKERITLIEARKSAPNPCRLGNMENLDEYMGNLRRKYEHSIQICYAALHGRVQNELLMGNKLVQALKCPQKILFLLIVKNLKDEWCKDIQDALQKELQHLRHIWHADVLVVNEMLARKYRLIV